MNSLTDQQLLREYGERRSEGAFAELMRRHVGFPAAILPWGNQPVAMSAIQELEKTLLALPIDQRVTLAESLLSSIPPASEVWSEAEEMAEAERREREIESGQVQPLAETEFWRRIEAGRKR